jgi:hypothetical protein
MRYAPTLTPPDDDEAWSARIAAAEGADRHKIERLHDRLTNDRRKMVQSLAAKYDLATLASLATITLALRSTTEVLREGNSKSI